MTLTKTAVKKLLADERKAMREKQKNSLFMRRTLSIYNGMKKRAAEVGRGVPFTCQEFRDFVKVCPPECIYCGEPLKPSTLTPDHAIPIARGGTFEFHNLYLACKSCNWQKGKLTSNEFQLLLSLISGFEKEAQADVKRRLTIGGRWSWK